MASIVEQLQADALDRNVPVSDLLRQVKLAAAKLHLEEVEDWVEYELNGYSGEVPDYRMVSGSPVGFNPYRGWIPIGGDVEGLSRMASGQSIASLEYLVNRGDGTLHFPYPGKVVKQLIEMNDAPWAQFGLSVDRSQLVATIDQVRNLILDWAIKLEKAGILGSEVSFDPKEKRIAQSASTTINIGTIGAFAGNIGAGNVSGDNTVSDVFADLKKALSESLDDTSERQLLIEAVNDLQKVQGNGKQFASAYQKFVSLAANHMTVIAPFLPALTEFISG